MTTYNLCLVNEHGVQIVSLPVATFPKAHIQLRNGVVLLSCILYGVMSGAGTANNHICMVNTANNAT